MRLTKVCCLMIWSKDTTLLVTLSGLCWEIMNFLRAHSWLFFALNGRFTSKDTTLWIVISAGDTWASTTVNPINFVELSLSAIRIDDVLLCRSCCSDSLSFCTWLVFSFTITSTCRWSNLWGIVITIVVPNGACNDLASTVKRCLLARSFCSLRVVVWVVCIGCHHHSFTLISSDSLRRFYTFKRARAHIDHFIVLAESRLMRFSLIVD